MTSLVSFLAERQSCCDFKNFQVLLILPTIACGFRLEASGQNWAKKLFLHDAKKMGQVLDEIYFTVGKETSSNLKAAGLAFHHKLPSR